MATVLSDQCVGAGAAAGDTVGAPDLSYTPGLDSGCTATQGLWWSVGFMTRQTVLGWA